MKLRTIHASISIAMDNIAQQLMRQLTAPRAWFLLLLPLFLFLVICYSYNTLHSVKKQQQVDDHCLPPSPPGLPLIGHLHLIGSLPHISLRCLTTKHGVDLMLLRFGAMPVLVVSSPRAAEAVLRTQDHVLASRPSSLAAEIILYGSSDIAFAPYGDAWRKARMLITTHLLSMRRVQLFRHSREEEVRVVMGLAMEAAAMGTVVDMGKLMKSFLHDLICRTVMGKSSCGEGRSQQLQELIADTSPLFGGFNMEDFFPFLARFGVLSKAVRIKRMKKRWDKLLDRLIDEHESKFKPTMGEAVPQNDVMDEDDNFIQILLSVRDEYNLTRDKMKAILVDVFFAGIDTTAMVLEYTFVDLIQRPHAMTKLQAEVRSIVDAKGQEFVSEKDLNNMTYLRAVIKESLRLHPPAPVLVPHFSMASCSIDGFVVPSGVRVLVNIWAIGRDARFWEDAEEFIPERFLEGGSAAQLSFLGTNNFQFLPFGAGRRLCPGINYSMASVELMLANMVHRLDWALPEGKGARDIDMSEEFGLVVRRKEKLLLVPKLVAVV